MHQQISAGTIDSPSWDLVRTAKLAARMYAPLGTRMSLGDHVRVVRAFLDALKASDVGVTSTLTTDLAYDMETLKKLREDLKVRVVSPPTHHAPCRSCSRTKAYQDQLARWGIKDDRIRRPPPHRATILARMLVRLTWFLCLLLISLPGLTLWLPVFATTFYATHSFKRTGGPIWDTWDELAQYKLVYGLASGLCVWVGAVLATLPLASVTVLLVPALMWMTLRWFEDAVSALRALFALGRLLRVGKPTLKAMRERRADLHSRVMNLAVRTLGLQDNPEEYFVRIGGKEKGRVRGKWESGTGYFSVRRRRKRDWNETLRLYDKVDYPEENQ
jgi:glycerol-3-phosphate O-acyltransferase/dihydroxyacetone phosphate acyltransferase